MQVKVWSDLHTEFKPFEYEKLPEHANMALILSGDIGLGVRAEPFINQLCSEFAHVIFVCGNHEFYHHEYYSIIDKWEKIELTLPNFHFLNNCTRVIDGVRFIGGTMWTSYNNNDPVVKKHCRYRMNDYSEISVMIRDVKNHIDVKHAFSPNFAALFHAEFVAMLLKELNTAFAGETVVCTHHSPANHLLLDKVYHPPKSELVNYAYYAGLNNIIEGNKIKLWTHGHEHISRNYLIGDTRIICNPRGYWGHKLNDSFNEKLVIEI